MAKHIKFVDIIKQNTDICRAFQVFLGSPMSLKTKEITPDMCNQIKEFISENNIKLFSHGAYVFNIAQYTNYKNKGEDEYDKSLTLLDNAMLNRAVNELENISKCGGIGSVFHVGKHLSKNKDVDKTPFEDNMFHFIKDVIDSTNNINSWFILETAAGQGTELLVHLKELGDFYNRFNKKYKKRVKICIDTCHIYASGFDIRDNCEIIISNIDKYIGWNNVALIHLNDSQKPLNSRVD